MQKILDPIKTNIFCRYSKDLNILDKYHTHDACEIYIFINGNAYYYIEQSCYHLTRGNILVIRPGEYHRIELIDKNVYERISLNMRNDYFETFSTNQTNLSSCFFDRPFGEQNLAILNEQNLKEFILLINQLKNSITKTSYGYDLMSTSYLLQILVKTNQLFKHNTDSITPNIMPPLIQDIIEYIEDHLLETISLQTLSEVFYHNSSYISHRFKNITGLTIQQYILHKKINLAQNYLKEGLSVTDSCMMSGFNNYSNFARTFTQQMGCSPKKYQTHILNSTK